MSRRRIHYLESIVLIAIALLPWILAAVHQWARPMPIAREASASIARPAGRIPTR